MRNKCQGNDEIARRRHIHETRNLQALLIHFHPLVQATAQVETCQLGLSVEQVLRQVKSEVSLGNQAKRLLPPQIAS